MDYINLQQKIRDYVAAHHEAMLQDLSALISIPSVAKPGKDSLPYGRECYESLLLFETIAKRMGFETTIYDNAALTIEWGGRPLQLGIVAHLDVVEAGGSWDTNPYTMVQIGDRLVGRGVADDKGPAIAALYAMDAIRTFCPDLPYGVQLWLGSAEEIGSPDMKHYLQHHTMPPIVLAPDSSEPLCICESAKHRPNFSARWAVGNDMSPRVKYLQGGSMRNTIPGTAEALVTGLTAADVREISHRWGLEAEVSFEVSDTAGGLFIRANGRSAHINIAQEGRNAQTALIALLNKLPLADCASTRAIGQLSLLFSHGDMSGRAMGLVVCDDIMGTSRTNFTTCYLDDTGFRGQFDSRGPTNATPENYALIIDNALRNANFTVDECEMEKAHYVPADAPIVHVMQELWHQVWGILPHPSFSFGSTYAHHIEGAIAFGVGTPGVDLLLHKPNEFLPLGDLERQVELCSLAIARLCAEKML